MACRSQLPARVAGALVATSLCLAWWPQPAGAAPAPAAAARLAGSPPEESCKPTSCTYTRPGQSLFHVPDGVTLLHVVVISAALTPPATPTTTTTTTTTVATTTTVPTTPAAAKPGDHVEVEGNVALTTEEHTLEVVVGGDDTLGGTTSALQTSTTSTAKVLVAARAGDHASTPATTTTTSTTTAHPSTTTSTTTTTTVHPATSDAAEDRHTIVPPGGTVRSSHGPARVTVTWVAPGTAPVITSPSSVTLQVGTAAAFVVTAQAPAPPALSHQGTLPAGTVFKDNSNGTATLEGTPKKPGSYPLTVTADDPTTGGTVTQHLIVDVDQAPAFTSPTATTLTKGAVAAFKVTTTGYPTPTLTTQGALPPGTTFTDNRDGTATLAGTPAQPGDYPFTVVATSERSGTVHHVEQHLTVRVGQPPTFTGATSATMTKGVAASVTIATAGYPAAALTVKGTLPPGVTFTDKHNNTATLAGTPTQPGDYTVTITADNKVGAAATQHVTIHVKQAPKFTSAPSTTLITGIAATFTITTTGYPVPTLTEEGALPPGMAFTDKHNNTATLAGTPTQAGTYVITVSADNKVGAAVTQQLTIAVSQPSGFTSASAVTFTEGVANTFAVTTTGTPVPALAEQGALPPGVTFTDNHNNTATLAGTPTQAGTYTITITADNKVGAAATQRLAIAVDQPPAFTSPASTTLTTGVAATFTVTTTGYPVPALTEQGTLPPGLTFTDNHDGTATVAGTPTQSGQYSLALVADNQIGGSIAQDLTIVVSLVPTSTKLTYERTGRTRVWVSLELTATVDPAGRVPTGTVTFFTNRNRHLGTAPLDSAGVAMLAVRLPAGAHILGADYHPERGSGFTASSSPVLSYTATPIPAPAKQTLGFTGTDLRRALVIGGGIVVIGGLGLAIGLWEYRRRRSYSG